HGAAGPHDPLAYIVVVGIETLDPELYVGHSIPRVVVNDGLDPGGRRRPLRLRLPAHTKPPVVVLTPCAGGQAKQDQPEHAGNPHGHAVEIGIRHRRLQLLSSSVARRTTGTSNGGY